ncbi:MAG: hypothetical protein V3V27_00075 [Candidatus Thermoplasmatota archaeon]
MDKNENVFIKLQIEKDHSSGDLMLILNFDKNAPNFLMDKDTIRWSPTSEELDLVMETYEITSKKKNRVERYDEEVRNTIPYPHSDDKTEVSLSDEPSERKVATFEPLEGDIGFKESPSESVLDKKDDEEKIFVQVDEKTIDAALKRESVGVGEALILDEDDKSIIDEMLKKRGKNKDKT